MKKILVLILFINISIFGQQANDLKSAKINFKISTEDGKIYKVTNLREISETAFTEIKKNELQFTTSVKKLKTTEIQLLVISNSVF